MAKSNDDIISPRLQHGILASALADLQKYGHDSSNGRKQITPRFTSLYNSPLSTYRGIIGTALRNEISTIENGYIPSQSEEQLSEKSFPKRPISLNGHKSLTSSMDTNYSVLQSARYTRQQKGNKRGMISRWLQDIAESTPDLSRKQITVSPRTGILGLLLKKKAKFQYEQTSDNTLSSSPDPTTSETNSVTKESRISQKNRSLLSLKNAERSHDKHLSLEDLDRTSINPSAESSQSILSRRDGLVKDRSSDFAKWSTHRSPSKESKSSITRLIDGDGYDDKSISVKVCLELDFIIHSFDLFN